MHTSSGERPKFQYMEGITLVFTSTSVWLAINTTLEL